MNRSEAALTLRKARQKLNLSREQLARQADVPAAVIQEIEQASESVALVKYELLWKALRLEPSELKGLQLRAPVSAEHSHHTISQRPSSPYMGLDSFQESDSPFFYGRLRITNRLLGKLSIMPNVGVIGASGSGKSSVVRAGLIPSARSKRPTAASTFRPGRKPVSALAATFASHLSNDAEPTLAQIHDVADKLRDDPVTLLDTTISRLRDRAVLFIFVDQFEELFVQCEDPAERKSFISIFCEMIRACRDSTRLAKFVFSLRSDFYPQFVNSTELSETFQDCIVNLPPMSTDELREAITKPAIARGRQLEASLVEEILKSAATEPGSTPLVSYCLRLLWDRCSGEVLTLAEYENIGGLAGSIASQAEEVFQQLGEHAQAATRRLMSRLVTVSDPRTGAKETKRTLFYDTLLVNSIERAAAEQLIKSRLLTTDYDASERGRKTIELAHEAVIHNWARLDGWLLEDRAFLLWQQSIEPLCEAWRVHDKSPNEVLRGGVFNEGQRWIATHLNDMQPIIREYLLASQKVFEEELSLRLEGLYKTLLGAESANVIVTIAEIRAIARPDHIQALRQFTDKHAHVKGAWKLRLLLLSSDNNQAEHVLEHLASCDPADLQPICAGLSDIAEYASASILRLLENPTTNLIAKVRLACAYANVSAETLIWPNIAMDVTSGLLAENPLHLLLFARSLVPAATFLFEHILEAMQSEQYSQGVQDNAALVLLELAGDDPDKVASVLLACNDTIFPRAFDHAKTAIGAETLISVLTQQLGAPPRKDSKERTYLEYGKRKATAGAALFRLGRAELALSIFDNAAEPDTCSQFAFRAASLGIEPELIAGQLIHAESPNRLYWLALALGEFTIKQLDLSTRDRVIEFFTSHKEERKSAIVHAISVWWLRFQGLEEQDDSNARRDSLDKLDLSVECFELPGPAGLLSFCNIPAGQFVMGSPSDEDGHRPYEGPQHLVELPKNIFMCSHGVTVREFRAYQAQSGHDDFPDISDFSPTDDHPIIALTWNEADDYCRWLTEWMMLRLPSSTKQFRLRLPTEAEWERAARGGTATAYSFGSDHRLLSKFAWFEANSGFIAHPFGALRPNQFGLFDMHGNCWEWCADLFHPYQPESPREYKERTLRGGCWNLHRRYSRSACRNWHSPANRNYYTGMRVVLEIE